MNKGKKGYIGQSLVIGLLAVFTLVLYGAAVALHRNTIIDYRLVVGIVSIIAITTGIVLINPLKRLCSDIDLWMKVVASIIFAGGLYLFSFYGLNYYFADKTTIHEEKVVVERKYYEVHHHSQRAGRRGYSRGTPYNVYYIEIAFPNGRMKTLQISRSKYQKTHKGDKITFQMEKGLLGFPVIKSNVF